MEDRDGSTVVDSDIDAGESEDDDLDGMMGFLVPNDSDGLPDYDAIQELLHDECGASSFDDATGLFN